MTIKNIWIKRTSYLLVIILLLALFFRFYNLQNWLSFGMDQEYEAFLVKNIVNGIHFPLIGVNVSDTGLYLGPAFIYFATVPYVLFGGNPIGWGITASIFGVLTVYLIFRIGKEMFSDKVGIFSSLLYAGSFLTSFYDRKFWNPMPVPLFSLLIGLFLFRIMQRKSVNLVWLIIFFGLSFHVHLSLLIFTPLILFIIWIRRKIFSKKLILLSLALFLLIQTPIIAFEIRHNFLNNRAAVNLIFDKSIESVSTVIEKRNLVLSTVGRYFWLPTSADLFLESGQCKELSSFRKNAYPEGIILVFIGIIIFSWWSFWTKEGRKSDSAKIILGIFFTTFLFVIFYNREIFEYYFLYIFPWLSIVLGKSLSFIWDRKYGNIIVIPIITLFIILNISTLLFSNSSYSYKDKVEAINFVRQNLFNKNYSLEALGECPRFEGYRYLFEYFIKTPDKSYMDSYFGWLYKTNGKSNSKVVLLSLIDPRDIPENISKWEKEKINFISENRIITESRYGRIHVLILEPIKHI